MKSQIFYTDTYKVIQARISSILNSHADFLTGSTAESPRAVGDAIQDILGENFETILGNYCDECSTDFARRAMADLAFTDKNGLYYVVDVSTFRTDTSFNMPNITSVERLSRFYEDDKNYFCYLGVSYHIIGTHLVVTNVNFVPIEFLMWDCLTIGALGWGQIQIANSKYVNIQPYSRKKWMLEFCDVMLSFYPKEIGKIHSRIERFQKIKKYWESKKDEQY